MPPIVKTVYYAEKAAHGLDFNFSIFLLFQVKIPDEKNTRHVYLLGENMNIVHFY